MKGLPQDLNLLRLQQRIAEERKQLAERREHQLMAKMIEDRVAVVIELPMYMTEDE